MGWLPSWQVILFTLEGIPTIIAGTPPLDLAQNMLVSECDTVLPTTGPKLGSRKPVPSGGFLDFSLDW